MTQWDRRRSRAAVPLLVAALLVAGCSAEADVGPSSPPVPSESATEAPQPSEPVAPTPADVEKPVPSEAIRRDDVAGAEAAAQYFLELYPYVYASGDLDGWKEMSHPECKFCESVVENVKTLHDSGGFARGGDMDFEQVSSHAPVPGNSLFRVDLLVSQAATQTVDGSGVETESAPTSNLLILGMDQDVGQWMIRAVQVEEPDFDG